MTETERAARVETLKAAARARRARRIDPKTLVIFVLGAALVAMVGIYRAPVEPTRVVCEQGTFEPVWDAEDPYLRERAVCNLDDANGPVIEVLVID